MSWKDSLLPASFRGVEFKVADIDATFGRRGTMHEYPLRDEPYTEDLGRKGREYTINAYIIGNDYLAQRDALIDAIENNADPGTLVHPTLGTLLVKPTDKCRVIYNNQEGGIERFVLSFVESGTNQFPDNSENTSFLTDLAANSGISDILSNFADVFNVSGLPDFVLNSAQSFSDDFVRNITSALSIGVISASLLSNFIGQIQDFSDDSGSLISSYSDDIENENIAPTDTFAGRITGLVSGLSDVYSNPSDAYRAQKSLVTFGQNAVPVPETTPSRIQEAANQGAIINLVRNSALIEMMRATSQIEYASRTDAINIRDETNDLLDPQLTALADAGNDPQYLALNKARSTMVKDINTRGAKLKDITSVKTYDSVPAIVFAYKQYEDAKRDEEIISRNNIRNPVFLPPNSDIEILI